MGGDLTSGYSCRCQKCHLSHFFGFNHEHGVFIWFRGDRCFWDCFPLGILGDDRFFCLIRSDRADHRSKLGGEKFQRVDRAFSLSLRFCIIWGLAIAIVLAFTASGFAAIFNKNTEVVAMVAKYMAIVPISYGAAGIVLIASSTFIALGKPLPSVVMTLAHTLVVYIPLAHLGKLLWGMNGIFVGACVANLIVGFGAILWQRKTLKGQSKVRDFTPDNSPIQPSRNR
ncbi:MAG: hypothetical protein HC930_18000 [Hydrococcus sp. SU_1_0]|nr:hypothetical protein [Hydrococcus sp. SU_1_0]